MKRRLLLITLICIMIVQAVSIMPAKADNGSSFTILLLGVDSAGETVDEAGNSDAVVIASMGLESGLFKMVNLQRDTLVELPDGLGAARLCTATSHGGPLVALKTVNSLLTLDISYYVLVDMAGMEKIINTLNGLELDVATNDLGILLPDGKTKLFEKAGPQTLNTQQVMAYMNSPVVLDGSNRSARLTKILIACLNKALTLDLGNLLDFASEFLNYVETNMTLNDMMNVAFAALSVKLEGIETLQFPQVSKAETRENKSVVIIDNLPEEVSAVHRFLLEAAPVQP